MMKHIKQVLAFLWGAAYASCVWWIVTSVRLPKDGKGNIVIPVILLLVSTVVILGNEIYWLAQNWNKE